ncbi:uncharacterized protein LOC125852375 [Solanum stenotomum]|uniref:uncharacterized protein LOC125852375 n=1 Tax=Solanum stenotomum TaxID=172797 RepID=UPI0020D17900|nr:uncharacterized protein LOC125852375 [Solanum stenotomum]
MDSTINTVASSEIIPTPSVAANPSASVATESPMEVIARLERQIGELNLLVAHFQAASQNLPPDARQKGHMPPSFPTSSELNQGEHFTTFQPAQSASLTHSTQDTPLVYTFTPPKAPTVAHHAPPVYTYVTAPHVSKAQEFHRQDVNHYVEIENDTKSIDAEMMNRKMKSLEDAMRGLRGFDNRQSVRYEELCTFPEVELPLGYKIPKFEKFSGSGNPFFHLKIYCEKLIGVGNNEGIRIKLFNQSLTGKALEWYSKQDVTKWRTWDDLANAFVDHYKFHVEIAPDRISITKLKPKSTECFREYAIRWREEAARVHPPMEESEMITYFIQAQDSEYYERMVTMGGKTFAEVIKAGEMIEDGLKTGRIASYTSSQFANRAYQTSSFGKKKEKEVMMLTARGATSYNRQPPPSYPGSQYYVCNNQSTFRPPRPMQNHRNEAPRPNFERKPPRVFTPLCETRTQLFERLKEAGILHPVEAKTVNTAAEWYDPNKRCAYHSGVVGHDTEKCITLKHKIQDLIDNEVVKLAQAPPNVNTNPLPKHKE